MISGLYVRVAIKVQMTAEPKTHIQVAVKVTLRPVSNRSNTDHAIEYLT